MSDTYLILIVGAIAGVVSAFLGGVILYRDRLRTHSRFQQRVEEERTALYNEILEIEKEEYLETDAGKDLMTSLQGSIQQFGYPREDLTTSLRRHNYDLLKEIDQTQKRLAQSEERLVAMSALQQESEKVVERLNQENEELHTTSRVMDRDTSTNSSQLEKELRLTLEELARLQNQLAGSNMRLLEAEKRTSPAHRSKQAEEIGAVSQGLRQPISSIQQYTRLLLDEYAGILNGMQRNFLETIMASTERIGSVIHDFSQVTNPKTRLSTLDREPVDLSFIINHAMSDISSQINAKNVSLNVDLPKNLAPIYADREALQKIFMQILSYATAASPVQGTVHVRVQIKAEDHKEYLLIQVSDTGGMPPEVLLREFNRSDRTDKVPSQDGVYMDVRLSMAKTLTEAQDGRIWVHTEAGVGTTYNVLIPMRQNTQVNGSTKER